MTHPALVLFATALFAALSKGTIRRVGVIVGCVASIWSWAQLSPGALWNVRVGDVTLSLLQVDALSSVFGLILTMVATIGIVYALHNDRGGEHAFSLIYAGGALGVVFAGDWVTLFVFWELMAVSSLFVVWEGRSAGAARAGYRYLLVHILGGSLLFAGILIHIGDGGSLEITALTADGTTPLAFWLILLGVAINAAIPPLHAWLTDAYPEASVTGSIFLSAFTTKTAVYVLIRVFPGASVLVVAGVIMALYGVVYAVVENDIRRLLAYHIVSQVGYMVAGVGMGTALALDGAAAHAFSHILYKSLLFMGTGAVIYATGLRKLTELGGISGKMKLVVALYAVGAFSISGVPLFNGFISKSMIISAAAASHRPVVELLLTLASVGTFLHTGLKLPYFTFFGPDKGITVKPVPINMLVAMAIGAFFCTMYGLFPSRLYALLPNGAEYHPYTLDHVLSAIQLLVGTALAFWLLLAKLGGEATVSVDTDWFYRRPFAHIADNVILAVQSAGARAQALSSRLIGQAWTFLMNPVSSNRPGDAATARDQDPYRFRSPVGDTVFWVVLYFVLLIVATELSR